MLGPAARSGLARRALLARVCTRAPPRRGCAAGPAHGGAGKPASAEVAAAQPQGAAASRRPGWLSRNPQYPLAAFLFGIGFFVWRSSRSNSNQSRLEDALTDQQAISHAEVDEVRAVTPIDVEALTRLRSRLGRACSYEELIDALKEELGRDPEDALSPQWAPVERSILSLAERAAVASADAVVRERLLAQLEQLWGKEVVATAFAEGEAAGEEAPALPLPAVPAAARKALVRAYKRHVRLLRGEPARSDEVLALKDALRGRAEPSPPPSAAGRARALAAQLGLVAATTPATELRRLGRALRRRDAAADLAVGTDAGAADGAAETTAAAAARVRLDARAWLTALALVARDDMPSRLRFVHGLFAPDAGSGSGGGGGGEMDAAAAQEALSAMLASFYFPAEFLVVQTRDYPARVYAAARAADLADKLRESAAAVADEAAKEAERAALGDAPKTERAAALRAAQRAQGDGCLSADEFMFAVSRKPLCALGACYVKAKKLEEGGEAEVETEAAAEGAGAAEPEQGGEKATGDQGQ